MFIISLTYKVSLDVVDGHLTAHVAWLDQAIRDGWLLLAGRKVPRVGGILIARGDRADIEARVATDPFLVHGVADAEIIEIQPSKLADEVTFGSLRG